MRKFRVRRAGVVRYCTLYVAAALVLFVSLFPFLWMVSTSFKPPSETFTRVPRLIPVHPTLENYRIVLGETMIPRYFLNSVYVALLTTAISLVVAALGAYGFSRFRFPGRSPALLMILSVQMFPSVVIIIPLFIVMRNLHLLNTHYSLLVSYTTFTLPLCVWMLKGFFDGIPRELEEAALIDGCSKFGAFLRIALPLSAQGIVASAIFAFIGAWNEFMFAMTFINIEELKTMPVGLTSFFGRFTVEWNPLMAASVLFTIPSLVFFVFVQRNLARGLVSGAVKG
ncbi:MAG: carbohydrate ABC transporter permease [Bacillota bacterium]|nr:carbohydrate ABC transporter permease [Bacillota bacterium]